MAMGWKTDKRYADRFEPEIKRLLADIFITAAPQAVDELEATDLLMLEVRPYRIACRMRKFKYWHAYPDEFTVRLSRPSGTKTELEKIVDGFGDFLFYGFADTSDLYVHAAYLIDLNVFRSTLTRHYASASRTGTGPLVWFDKTNGDQSSMLRAYKIGTFPNQLLKRTWKPEELSIPFHERPQP